MIPYVECTNAVPNCTRLATSWRIGGLCSRGGAVSARSRAHDGVHIARRFHATSTATLKSLNRVCHCCFSLLDRSLNLQSEPAVIDPFETGSFYVFPSGGSQQPEAERFRYELITAVFQLRHTLVHNLGVLTESDTTKLRHMLRTPLNGSQVLAPSSSNVRQIKRFLDETAQKVNERIAIRLAALLTKMHNENALIFDPAAKAQTLANSFSITTSVCGQTASPIQALVR